MTGNAHQRKLKKRAKEREVRKKMEEARYEWNESLAPRPVITESPVEDLEGREPDQFISTPIVQPEPSGEAEGPLVICTECGLPMSIVCPGDWECRNAGCKLNVEEVDFWKELENYPMDEGFDGTDVEYIQPPKKKRGIWNWIKRKV